MKNLNKIIISRPDSIGDVILTLPICGYLKGLFPDIEIIFIGKKYTQSVINACIYVDQFIAWDGLTSLDGKIKILSNLKADAIIHAFPDKEICTAAFQAKIPLRIATGNRVHTLLTCNKKVWFSRKKSDLHESQLNFKLLSAIGLRHIPSLEEIPDYYGLNLSELLSPKLQDLLDPSRKNLIFHPKSKGSAVEWGLKNFNSLINKCDPKKYKIFVTGTEDEGQMLRGSVAWSDNVIDLTGKMTLEEYIIFISKVDLILAGSTGPLHIGAALGIRALGLYPSVKPINPDRWKPLGKHAYYMEDGQDPIAKFLMIEPSDVLQKIEEIIQ